EALPLVAHRAEALYASTFAGARVRRAVPQHDPTAARGEKTLERGEGGDRRARLVARHRRLRGLRPRGKACLREPRPFPGITDETTHAHPDDDTRIGIAHGEGIALHHCRTENVSCGRRRRSNRSPRDGGTRASPM